jgi:hypothetical protein
MRPVGVELFQAGGQKNMTKLIVAFRNHANELKNASVFPIPSVFHSHNFASQSHYKYLKLMLL